jgi:hypothetical protein
VGRVVSFKGLTTYQLNRHLDVPLPLWPLLRIKLSSLSILIIKPTRCTNFSNLFWNRTPHVSNRFSVHHQESSTVHTAIGICHTGYADCLLAGSLIPLASSQHNLDDIYLFLCVQCYSPDDGQKTCSKHVEFYSKINLRN